MRTDVCFSIRKVRGINTALGLAAQMSPICPTDISSPVFPSCFTDSLRYIGILAALIVPTLIVRFPGDKNLLGSMVSFLVGNVMASVAPAHGTYWSVTFPSLILVIFGPGKSSPLSLFVTSNLLTYGLDMSFATGQLIVSNSVEREFQGIAAGIVSMIANYSCVISFHASSQ